MDSGKQTEGIRGEGVGGWASLVMGGREGTYCMVHWVLYASNKSGTLHQKLGVYCTVTNMI